ncbi:MAG: 50S ribosomal protein L35ae [Thermoprotei archaeon]
MEEQGEKQVRGIIVGYVRGPNTQYSNFVLVKLNLPEGVKPDNFIGRRVLLIDKHGNEYRGKIVHVHSRKHGVVEARFKPNIPGQAIGSVVIIK